MKEGRHDRVEISPGPPSLDSLRKQAKQLARGIAAGDAAAIARVGAHLPHVNLPLTQRNAQLVIAREYGYAGWHELRGAGAGRCRESLPLQSIHAEGPSR
jgi:hypothetical protein